MNNTEQESVEMPPEGEILSSALTALEETTGLKTTVLRQQERFGDGARPDAVVRVHSENGYFDFLAEVRAVDRFATPAAVKLALEGACLPPLLVAPYISAKVAERCRSLGLAFIDTSGNAFLHGAGLFVLVTGRREAKRPPQIEYQAVSPAGMRIGFALLCQPELASRTYREIADAAGTSLGTVAAVIPDLVHRHILRAGADRTLRNSKALFDEWVTQYPIALRPKLHARRFSSRFDRPDEIDLHRLDACWGGEVAAARLTNYLQPGAFTIYTGSLRDVVRALHLRADPAGSVEVLDRFWKFHANTPPGVVPPILAYADLIA
ncbi:MAG: hypothetical protein H6509_10110, partial [Bryobacterales bacterium]|nr:hypothetical protein [Bryobacterales bacterium]